MNKLPKGWNIYSWSDVLEVKNGKNQKAVLDENGNYPIYGSGGIMAYANDYLCDEGTTIIGRKGSINNPIYVESKFWNVDTAFGISPKSELDSKLLFYFCLGYDFTKHNKSTTLPSLTKSDLLKIQIPLPPLPEQKRIVSKLDALFERIDKSMALLEENITHTESLMASTLDEVFTSNSDKWELKKFSDFASLRHGHQFRKYDFVENGIPVVKIGQCKKDGSLDLSNCNFIAHERLNEFEADRIYKGDLLMALTGGTLGKVTWVDDDYGTLVQNYRVGNFFPINGKSIKRFLMYVLMSDIFQNLVADKVNQGAQPNIGKEHIDNMLVPLPSISEQVQLVEKLDVILKNQTLILEQQNAKLNNLKALKESILDRAFKGEI